MGGNNNVSRRLSKPRTNTSSSNLLIWPDSPAEISSPIASSDLEYFGDHATTVSSQGERRSRRKSRTKLRAYLYGSPSHESSQSLSSDEDEERQNGLAGAARGAKKRLSRTGSSIMQLSSAKASTNYLSCGSSSNLLSMDPEESVRVAEEIKERARLDTIAAQNHVTSPVDDDKHVDSIAAPVRRKSLYTPGIATRQSSDILRKPPPPQSIQSQADRDYYYNPAYPESSPLAKLAALNISDDGRSTPIMNVTHLGGLQLGSLRVTNGTASPIPQDNTSALRHLSPAPSSNLLEDFQTASEGSEDEGRATPRHLGLPIANVANESSTSTNELLLPRTRAIEDPWQENQGPCSKRTSFPFHQQSPDYTSAMASEYMLEIEDNRFAYSETPLQEKASFAQDRFEDEGIVLSRSQEPDMEALRSIVNEVDSQKAGHGTREDAFSRLNGSSSTSSYSTSTDAAPKTDSGYSSNASSRVSQHRMSSQDASSPPKPQRSALRSRVVSGPREMPLKRPGKDTDSFLMDPPPQVRPSFTVIPRYALADPEPVVSSSGTLEKVDDVRSSARSQSQGLVKKLRKARPRSQPPPAPPVDTITVQKYRELEQFHIPRVPSQMAARHAERLVEFPLLDHTFPSLQHVSAQRSPTLKEFYPVPIRFPSPANAIGVATAAVSSSPLVAQPTDSLSPSSIRNVGVLDDEHDDSDIIRSPSWSAFGGSKQKKLQKRAVKEQKEAEKRIAKDLREIEKKASRERKDLDKNSSRDESREVSSRSRRSSWGRVKSSERGMSEHDARATISDFGTVTESLGGSPYDIARPVSFASQQSGWHPHQMSTAIPRPRSMTGIEEATFTSAMTVRGRTRNQGFGRPNVPTDEVIDDENGHRGRNVRPYTMFLDAPPVPALSAVDIRQQDLDWTRHRQSRSTSRPREDMNEAVYLRDHVDSSVKSIRPQSMFADVPPVPALPSVHQVRQREAALTKPRPHTIVVDSSASDPATTEYETQAPTSAVAKLQRNVRKSQMTVPDVWTGGSLEKKTPKPVDIPETSVEQGRFAVDNECQCSGDSMWEAQRQAWSERRKSAGQALFLKNQLNDIFATADPSLATPSSQSSHPHPTMSRSMTDDTPSLTIAKNSTRSGPGGLAPYTSNQSGPSQARPLLAHQQPKASSFDDRQRTFPSPAERRARTQDFSVPRKRVGSGKSTPRSTSAHRSSTLPPTQQHTTPIATPIVATPATIVTSSAPSESMVKRLTGRYEGGLLYGFEPGQGLGGSAGIRGSSTEASRKSVDVSKSYGVDLSDVPVFVAQALR